MILGIQKSVLTYKRILELAQLWDYSTIRSNYWETVHNIIVDFLSEKVSTRVPKAEMQKAISQAFYDAAVQAYRDAGAALPLDSDTIAYLDGVRSAEFGYVNEMVSKLLMIRKEEGDNVRFIAPGIGTNRADGYARTLDRVYANVKLLARPNVMLTFTGHDGKESCPSCRRYKGKRMRAKTWVAHSAVPPSRDFECGGYNCEHHLVDDNGRLYTL